MSRDLHGIEQGIRLTDPNSDVGADILFGLGGPGGDTSFQDDAPKGSTYKQLDGNGDLWTKKTAGSGTDKWVRQATTDDVFDIKFRSEKVVVATGEVISAGARDLTASPFTDDEGALVDASNFVVGNYIISGIGGTVKLFKATVVASPSVTFVEETVNPLSDQDRFVVNFYLPDSPDAQEKQALVHYDGTTLIKLGDVNWDLANGINLSGSYTPATGDITSSDTVESAIEKLDGNNDAQDSALGITQGDSNMGSFTGPQTHLTDNVSAKQGIQENANQIVALEGQTSEDAVTTETVIDSVLVDEIRSVLWQVDITLGSDEARVRSFLLRASHDGKTSLDAASAKETSYAKLRLGATFNRVVSVGFSGAGLTQKMELKVSASSAVNVRAQRVSKVNI